MPTARKKAGKKKVFCINRFRFRYELAEDVRFNRKSPLLFTKDFVGSGSDDESCSYWRQLLALRSKPNWLELRGAFAELKNIAGNTSKMYRGFLLNSNFEPASVRDIGRWLGCDEKKAQVIVAELLDVELLDCVDFPGFETDDKLAGKSKKRKRKSPVKRTKTPPKKSGRSRKRTGKPGGARERTGTHGKARAPLKEKTNAKGKVKGKGKINANANGNGGRRERNNNGKHRALEQERQSKCKATPLSTLPRKSATGGRGTQSLVAPPKAAFNNRGPELLGDIVRDIKHKYDFDCKNFGGEIYETLGLTFSPLSIRGRRELGAFASVWERAKTAGLPPDVLEDLRHRAVAEACKVAKRRQRCANVSAVWCHIFARLLSAASGTAARTELGGCG